MADKPDDKIKELEQTIAGLTAELADYRKYFSGQLQQKLKENKTHEEMIAESAKQAAKIKAEIDNKLKTHKIVAETPIVHNGKNYGIGDVIADLDGFNIKRKLDNGAIKFVKK